MDERRIYPTLALSINQTTGDARNSRKIMNTTNNTPTVHYASCITSGYGHKKITVELKLDGEYRKFTATTNAMHLTDEAADLEGQERYNALYDIIAIDIDDEVRNWVAELNEQ